MPGFHLFFCSARAVLSVYLQAVNRHFAHLHPHYYHMYSISCCTALGRKMLCSLGSTSKMLSSHKLLNKVVRILSLTRWMAFLSAIRWLHPLGAEEGDAFWDFVMINQTEMYMSHFLSTSLLPRSCCAHVDSLREGCLSEVQLWEG